jgi:ATP-binding cassette subfamily F protein uup
LLSDYAGTLLLVSHDRDFLDRVATSVIVFEGGGRWTEYAGGYSDMVAQRGYGLSGPAIPEAVVSEKTPSRASVRNASKRKMSFNEKRALELLPVKIEKTRGEIARLERALGEAELHARDPDGFQRATNDYAVKRKELDHAEEEWLALEILREEIEG